MYFNAPFCVQQSFLILYIFLIAKYIPSSILRLGVRLSTVFLVRLVPSSLYMYRSELYGPYGPLVAIQVSLVWMARTATDQKKNVRRKHIIYKLEENKKKQTKSSTLYMSSLCLWNFTNQFKYSILYWSYDDDLQEENDVRNIIQRWICYQIGILAVITNWLYSHDYSDVHFIMRNGFWNVRIQAHIVKKKLQKCCNDKFLKRLEIICFYFESLNFKCIWVFSF